VILHKFEKKLIGIRNGSPMIIGVGDQEYFISSDASAFLPYTQKVLFLDDNQYIVLTENGYHCFDLATNKPINTHVQTINWSVDQAQKGEFDHFMLKEVMEQSKTVYAASSQNKKDILEFAESIKKAYGSYIVACGTAGHAAMYGTYAFARIANRHINYSVGSEFEICQKFINEKSLIIAVSQSGETADTLMAIEEAKSKKAKTAAIVNVMGSTLMRNVDISFLSHAGPEIAVVSTKAFISQLSVLFLLAYASAGKYEEGKQLLEKTSEELAKLLNPTVLANIKQIALKLKNTPHIYCIGKGQNYPIAMETALKIKEASYIHAEGFAAGELKHGVIALIEKGTPCIVLFANDEDKAYSIGSAMEIKARGGHIIGIGPQYNEVFDEFIQTPDIPETAPLLNTPVIQLIAYYLAVAKGNNPDRPRNLAKSVTVK
jgi:glucosamine--fructose-6-phosphate aminotransferase (isomerizing)